MSSIIGLAANLQFVRDSHMLNKCTHSAHTESSNGFSVEMYSICNSNTLRIMF